MTNYTIYTTNIQPTTIPYAAAERCILCGQTTPPEQKTTGPYNAMGELGSICSVHLKHSSQFISLLADYMANERQRRSTHAAEKTIPDAWFLY